MEFSQFVVTTKSLFSPAEAKYFLTSVPTGCHSAFCTELVYLLGHPCSHFWWLFFTSCATRYVGAVFPWLRHLPF